MTKIRQKSNEKSAAPSQEDVPKKSPKGGTNGVSGGPGPQGPRSGGCLGLLATTVFYVALVGAAGFAAFHFQQALDEIHQIKTTYEQGARQDGELSTKMESVVQQVESLRSYVDGLESSLGITRVELEAAVSRMKRGEVETRRVEEALQKLQNDLLRDLSEGIKEVKEARERDFSSLERTVEERLAEVSQSVSASVAEFAEAQGEAQSQLADLKARLGGVEDPTLLKQELSAIVDAVTEIKAAKQAADTTVDSLRQQIGAVREELQTRNQEVVSLSQEVQSVRSVVQETTGRLKQSLSATEAGFQALRDQTVTLQDGMEQITEAVRSVEERATAAAQSKSEEFETRVKASEESRDSLSASLSDISSKVESLLAKYDAHDSSLAAQGETVERVTAELKQELGVMKSSMEELRSMGGGHVEAKDSSSQVEELEMRLSALEDSSAVRPEELENLKTAVDELKSKAAELGGHDQAIAALQEALQETKQTLAGLFGGKQEEGVSSTEELQSKVAALSKIMEKEFNLDQQVEELEKRLAALEDRM
nr:cytoskeleton-associated protein 4 [Nothobranchius furzeri]XP_054595730.1 cytoskeleton-associated protein 4 [Nothobranchius furzeri]XP_054595731.1 cytoskeleton-associated protein 4 [Nothobranchius furzeri]